MASLATSASNIRTSIEFVGFVTAIGVNPNGTGVGRGSILSSAPSAATSITFDTLFAVRVL